MRYLLIGILFLTGCATTPHGKAIQTGQWGDIVTTEVGLNAGGVELNPLGLYILPIKIGLGKFMDRYPCEKVRSGEKIINGISSFAAANNIGVIAGMSAPLGLGVVGAITYLVYRYKQPLDCAK